MDNERKYKEALARAREIHRNEIEKRRDMEWLFPELKESEDEKIKNWLIGYFRQYKEDGMEKYANGLKVESIIVWLEKQGTSYTKRDVDDAYLKGVTDAKNEMEKQYEADYQIRKDIATFIFNYRGDIKDRAKWMNYLGIKVSFVEKQGEKPQGKTALEIIKEEDVDNANKVEPKDYNSVDPHFAKPIDKVGPKFKAGDWITNGDYTWKIVEVEPLDYILQSQDGNIVDDTVSHVDEQFHFFSIEDVKDGDVLVENSCIFIIQKLGDNNTTAKTYCELHDDGEFNDSSILYFDIDSTKPATKEEREAFFARIREEGYEWDAEKKELKITDFSKHLRYNPDAPSIIEKKPAWSEKYYCYMTECINSIAINNDYSFEKKIEIIHWLESLKDRIQN